LPARYGGEEFSILLGQTDDKEAFQVAARIHKAFSGKPFEVSEGRSVSITASLGVVTLQTFHDQYATLVKCADEALYVAKNNGRNQIAVWSASTDEGSH